MITNWTSEQIRLHNLRETISELNTSSSDGSAVWSAARFEGYYGAQDDEIQFIANWLQKKRDLIDYAMRLLDEQEDDFHNR